MTGHDHHHRQHQRITQALSWRDQLPPERRSHATRQLMWAINDHLRCCHGLRRYGQRTLPPIIELADTHAGLHRAGTLGR